MISGLIIRLNKKINYSIVIIFTILFFVSLLSDNFFSWINDTYYHLESNENGLAGHSKLTLFVAFVILAPTLETFLLQVIPNIILNKCKITNKYALILIPSVLFGLLHCYYWIYIIVGFIAGMILNYLYLFCKARTNYAFLIVILFHSLHNLYVFLFDR